MPSPTLLPSTPASAKRSLDIRDALRSTLRSWLVARDSALWVFCAGTNYSPGDSDGPAEYDDRLDKINLSEAQDSVDTMNSLRKIAVVFAKQLATRNRSYQTVLSDELDELLSSETPKFLLRVDGSPYAF